MSAGLTHRWSQGWAVSRGTAAPVATAWGLRIEVGAPNQLRRHVVLDPEPAGVRELAAGIQEPLTWIKSHVEPEVLAPWLPAGWSQDDPGWLMAADVVPPSGEPVVPPPGYTVTSQARDGVTYVRVLAANGELAARGQYGHAGEFGTVDQIATELEHRRRGLGSVVMDSLAGAAYELGAGTTVLGATVEGRALYEALGWKVHAPLAGFIFRK
jgi:GNAT superfamily N-acetyltransferase